MRFAGPRLAATSSAVGLMCLVMVFVFTVMEGALRKWVFAGSPPLRYAAYFSKDVMLVLAAMAGAAAAGGVARRHVGWILATSFLLILPPSLVNLANSNVVGAILSFRAYVLQPWCAMLAAGVIRSWKDVDRVLGIFGVLALGVAALGMLQFELPAGHWLNRYDLEGAVVVAQYGHVRAVGTFSYIAGMASMAGAAAWAGMYFFLLGGSMLRRVLGAAVAAAGMVCGLVSMSRSGILPCLLIIVIAPICFRRGKEVFLVAALGAVLYSFLGSGGAEETMESGMYDVALRRFEASDSFGDRIAYTIKDLMQGITDRPLGSGLGLGQPGGYAASDSPTVRDHFVESELGRIVMEVGLLGLVGVLLIRMRPIGWLVSRLLASRDRRFLALAAPSTPFLLLAAVTNLAFNHVLSSFYWGAVAVLLGCARLAVSAPEKRPRRPARRSRR